jgi:hypothetical protein
MCVPFKTTVLWGISSCTLVEIDTYFRSAYCLHHHPLMLEAVSTSEKSVSFYQTAQRNIPEESHPHRRRLENMKSHSVSLNNIRYIILLN